MNKLEEAKERAKREQEEWDREHREREKGHRELMLRFASEIRPHIKPAHSHEYDAWLAGYLKQGGEIGHVYDYPFPSEFYIAKSDFTLFPLYGASSISIIVPEGVEVHIEGTGHCNLYYMEEYRHKGSWVPAYSNTRV